MVKVFKMKGKRPVERKRVMELAQRREIDAVLVTEMTRWGRSTQDLMDTLGELASWDVSLIATTGLTFDLSAPQGKLVANLMASLAEFEHDLLRERVRSGVAAALVVALGSARYYVVAVLDGDRALSRAAAVALAVFGAASVVFLLRILL